MEQSEIDALMKEMDADSTALSDEGEDLGWDDVQAEMEASRKEEPKTEVASVSFGELQPTDPRRGAWISISSWISP